MLDVHPPHEAAHSWKDFFIHIATIVVGLLIAVGLEQTVEFFHHRHERHQLVEDLKAEAEKRVPALQVSEQGFGDRAAWYRKILELGRIALPSGGLVSIVLPQRTPAPVIDIPEDSAWNTAKASGTLNVLSHEEIEVWGRVDYYAAAAAKDADGMSDAYDALNAVCDRTGAQLTPGATIRLTPADRDELMRAIALVVEKMQSFIIDSALRQGSSDAALHGVRSTREILPYIQRTMAARPK
jgi:hypothetical protein